jgi:subtilisin family serine protease
LNRISISNSTQENEEELYQSIQTFWISNQMYIQGATVNVIEKIMHLNEIQEIREEIRIPFVAPIVEEEEEEEKKQKEKVTTSNTSTIEWGVERVHAPVAWNAGFHGQDIIVANIDTGVLLSHESLKNNFVGEYGWFDPEKKEPLPYDPQGHGTHTMGTMVGQNGIGVAPGAKWMACKGCRSEQGCVESDLLACAEFMTCPTDPQGNNRKCDKAPHVINNSWGGGQGETFFLQAVNAWIRAGIVPVFSNGNTGPKCQTANSPADLSIVISVGAIDQDDHLGSFSSKGPTIKNLIKPDISAPGVRVRSSINAGDNRYSFLSSTSMAAPHVSGVIALILNAKPTLSYDQLRALLYTSVEQSILKPSGLKCGNITDGIFPNNDFGYGLINVAKALDTLKINN